MSSLSHIKVIDLTSHLAGPYCAMILGDHGADVIKVENPKGGDQLRQTPPFRKRPLHAMEPQQTGRCVGPEGFD